jgi:signal transduction histidine kinase
LPRKSNASGRPPPNIERQSGELGGSDSTPLDEIAATSAEALSELRSTLKSLRAAPTGGAPQHPTQTIQDLADLATSLKGAGLDVDIGIGALPSKLPAVIAHAGYRIVQEGLTNVLRHSSASRATVRIGVDNGMLALEVFDQGPATTEINLSTGHGLQGMKERAVALGGTCDAGALDGNGWQVRALIPLDGASA